MRSTAALFAAWSCACSRLSAHAKSGSTSFTLCITVISCTVIHPLHYFFECMISRVVLKGMKRDIRVHRLGHHLGAALLGDIASAGLAQQSDCLRQRKVRARTQPPWELHDMTIGCLSVRYSKISQFVPYDAESSHRQVHR